MADQPRNDLDASGAGVPDAVQALIVRYYDNDLDEAGLTQLREALIQNAEARELFVAWGVHGQLLTESLSANYMEETDEVMQGSPTVLAELAELEERAKASLVSVHHIGKPWYVGRWVAGVGAMAAVIALAVVLTFVFHNPGDAGNTGTNNIADGSTPGTVETPSAHVATLTSTHDAVWSERALARGSELHAGQRLTLTAGFAEITTNDGAIAILEAPATIEFSHNDNALRLHSGKLVGICETESSKGFLVRTPHMDITDLGTRFGVDATGFETQVHVFEGEVQAARPDAGIQTEPIRLTANQSARTSADTQAIARIDHDTEAFASVRPRTITLPGTGLGLAKGEADPAWVVISEDGQPLPTPLALKVSDAEGHIRKLPNDPQQSQWLAALPESTPGEALPTYRIRTTIDVPADLDPSTARLAIQYVADNQLAGVLVNGTRFDLPAQAPQESWLALTPITIEQPLIAGTNTIEFEIVNYPPKEVFWGGSEYGLRVEWQLHASPLRFAEQRTSD